MSVPKGALLSAVNVDIDVDGQLTQRRHYSASTDTVSRLFGHAGRTYGVKNGEVGEVVNGSFVARMAVDTTRMGWGLLDNKAVFSFNEGVGIIDETGARQLGVADAGAPFPVAIPGLDLPAGRYAFAVAHVSSGEESGLSPTMTVDVFDGYGVQLFLPATADADVDSIRVYASRPDGDILYAVTTVPVGTTYTQHSGALSYQRPSDTQNLTRMVGGRYVRQWNGRLLVGRGHTLYYSAPYRYGLYNPTANFVRFSKRLAFVEPVDGGVYVGLVDQGVVFLKGDNPTGWEQLPASTLPPQPDGSISVPTAGMNKELRAVESVAVWLTASGFALGLPDGNVVMPQAERLSGLSLGTGSLVFEDDRLIALSQ